MNALPDATIARIREMRARGTPVQLIAQHLAMHPSTVRLYTSGKKADADEIGWMPSWRYQNWEVRAIQIREKHERIFSNL